MREILIGVIYILHWVVNIVKQIITYIIMSDIVLLKGTHFIEIF